MIAPRREGALLGLLVTMTAAAQAPARVDLHSHLTMARAAQPLFRGEPGRGPFAQRPEDFLLNQVDAASLRAAGIRIVVAALWPSFRLRPGRTALDEAVHQLDELEEFVRGNPDFVIARSAAELRRALEGERIALYPKLEGGEGIERVEDVDRLYAAGARAVTLVHFTDNAVAGAVTMPNLRALGWKPDPARYTGVTPLGEAALRRMFELGILVDLTHASEKTAAAALGLAEERGAPVILSHAGAWAVNEVDPNVSDELIARVAKGGGMIGVLVKRTWLGEVRPAQQLPAHAPRSCDDQLAHWRHFATLAGPANVALGSDFNGFTMRPPPGGGCPAGLRSARDLPAFFAALERLGIPGPALDGSAARFIALVAATEAASDPALRAAARRARPARPRLFDAPAF